MASSQIIINVAQPPSSNAGENQELCEDFTILNANSVQNNESGTWTVISGNAVFNDINNPNALISNLNIGENILEWTVQDACNAVSSQVTYNFSKHH